MAPATGQYGTTQSNGDLPNLDIIEDRCATRRKQGLPARYSKGRFLGKGGFAKCYEVQDMETQEVFAAKIVAKASIVKPRAMAKLKSEISIHRSLDHDKVVKFYDYFEDSDYVYIILELCPNQTLNEFIRKRPTKRLTEAEAMFYVYDLIMALKYLHRRQVIHRDLKLGNLFLDHEVRIKVGDFGLAAQLEHDQEKKRTICGTPNYIAPEILEGKHGHSYEVDIWSLGVIIYTMVIGRPPFETSDVKTTYRRIRYNQYSFPENVRISEQAKDLITSILKTDPKSRPSLDDILASSWFQNASRLPPPVPLTVSAFSASPRIGGSSSARSETPERGGVDLARIDSPAPRFPLRDRSPSNVPSNSNTPHQQPLGRTQSGAPLLPNKQAPAVNGYGGTTPGRTPSVGVPGGRPPLAHRGNEENVVPTNMCGNEAGCTYNAGSGSPGGNHSLQNSTTALCRPQSAHAGSCASGGNQGPNQGGTSKRTLSSGALRPAVGSAAPREASPLLGGTGTPANPQMSARALSARSTASSPRQGATLSSSRNMPGASTPKENRSARILCASVGDGGNGFMKTTPGVTRNAAGAQFSGRKASAPDSPSPNPCSARIAAAVQLTPSEGGLDEFIPNKTPLTTPPQIPFSERQHSSKKQDKSCSSPALLADGSQRDALTPLAVLQEAGREIAHQNLGASESSRQALSARQCPSPSPGPQVGAMSSVVMPELWVTKWVDYSTKYGVGYILSDGSIGVYFNDSTKIVLVPNESCFDYVTRRTQDRPEVRTTHTFEDYPEDLKKKVTLLRHFKGYMIADSLDRRDGASTGESSMPLSQPRAQVSYEPGQAPYVRKWIRNRHAIMFQLSNKIVQVVFFDRTEAIVSSRSHMVTYFDKRGQVSSCQLSTALDVPSPNPELAKRLRYTKDILVNLLGARTTEFANAGQA